MSQSTNNAAATDSQVHEASPSLSANTRLLRDSDTTPDDAPDTMVDSLNTLLDGVENGGTAFQAVAVAAVQILERALVFEREAAEAALSLGQREKMQAMVDAARTAVDALRDALRAQGAKAIHLCPECPEADSDADQPWWFALNDALGVLEEGSSRMGSLTAAQPEGSPARELSRQIATLLRSHHDALLLEADEWIS